MGVYGLAQAKITPKTIAFFLISVCGVGAPLITSAFGQASASPEWTTSSYNPQRDAWQRDETKITPENVKSIQLLWTTKADNKTMGMQSFREPLIVSGINTASGPQTLAILAGSSNDVFAIASLTKLTTGSLSGIESRHLLEDHFGEERFGADRV